MTCTLYDDACQERALRSKLEPNGRECLGKSKREEERTTEEKAHLASRMEESRCCVFSASFSVSVSH